MKLAMFGASGRMGQHILTMASEADDIEIVGAVDIDTAVQGKDIGELIGKGTLGVTVTADLGPVLGKADVLIDFTRPEASLISSEFCGKSGTALVVGTTGLSDSQQEQLKKNVAGIPCVYAPNMSMGVNLLFKLVKDAAAILGEDYDIEITEIHHRFKKDAPSGTAKRIAEIIADTLGTPLSEYGVYGREGITGERGPKEIGVHAIRTGDVVGEHTVTFGTLGERFELTHKAHSRDTFASGVLPAARFAIKAVPGLYDMQDVLGLK